MGRKVELRMPESDFRSELDYNGGNRVPIGPGVPSSKSVEHEESPFLISDAPRASVNKDDPEVVREVVRVLREVVCESEADIFERLDALRELRHMDADGIWSDTTTSARSDEVVVSMLDLIAAFPFDSELEIEVFQNLQGSRSPLLGETATSRLIHSQHDKIREEAAEVLASFDAQETIIEALEWAARNDLSTDVQLQAKKTLARIRGR